MTEETPTPNADAVSKKKKDKKPPPGLVIPPKRPKLTKAERRALQEKQRAAKAVAQGGKGGKQLQATPKKHVLDAVASAEKDGSSQPKSNSNNKTDAEKNDTGSSSQSNTNNAGNDCLDLFSHLPQYKGTWSRSLAMGRPIQCPL